MKSKRINLVRLPEGGGEVMDGERSDYRRGRAANMGGQPRNPRENIDWLRGWDDAQDDRALDDYDGWDSHD